MIQKVTWTGGSTPDREDSFFQFLGQPARRAAPTPSRSQQTYSDGSIVDWSGAESSDAPAPTIEAKSSLGGGGSLDARDHRARRRRARRSSLGAVALFAGGGSAARMRLGAARPGALRRGRGACAAGRRVRACVPDEDVPVGERDPRQAARRTSPSPSTRRSSRASRSSPSPTRTRSRSTDRAACGGRRPTPTRSSSRSSRTSRGLVPRLLAGDLGRRPSGAGRVHVRGRPEPRARAAVRDPAHRGDGATPTPRSSLRVGRVPDRDGLDRPPRDAARDRAAARPARRGLEPARRHARLRGRLDARRSSRSRVTWRSRPRSTRSARFFDFGALVPLWRDDRLRARLRRPGDLLRALRRSPPGSRSGSTARTASSARSPRSSPGSARSPPRRPCCSSPAPPATPRRPRRGGSRVALDWLHVVVGLALARRAGRAARALGSAAAAARRVAGARRRASRGSRTSRSSRSRCSSARGSGPRCCTCRSSSALWTTSYGQTILVKAGLLAVAIAVGAGNLLRRSPAAVWPAPARARPRSSACSSRPRWCFSRARSPRPPSSPSLAPPSKYLGQESGALAKVGPGPVAAVVQKDGYTLKVIVDPNKAAAPNRFALQITKDGRPVTGAERDGDLRDARHGDGKPGVRADRDLSRHLLAPHPGTRDGRALGPFLRRGAEGRRRRSPPSSSTGPQDDRRAVSPPPWSRSFSARSPR